MEEKDIVLLENLLYQQEEDYVISQLKNIDNPFLLHCFVANYNWNDGFNIPTIILQNEACDFGTGLLMFHYADGYRLIENPGEISSSTSEEWKNFLIKVYNKLLNLDFRSQKISFDPQLTKIQKYKMKKYNPELPEILISKSPGQMIDIPNI